MSERRTLADRLFQEILDPRGHRYPGSQTLPDPRRTLPWMPIIKLLVLITDELWGPGETKVEEWE